MDITNYIIVLKKGINLLHGLEYTQKINFFQRCLDWILKRACLTSPTSLSEAIITPRKADDVYKDFNLQFSFQLIFEAIKKYQKDKNKLRD